jgi:Glycosyltransferases, probably involved in cell wall biogenesis
VLDYLIINNEGKVVGKSATEGNKKIKIPIKPFQKNVVWNGKKLVYNFPTVEKKETEEINLFKAISSLKLALATGVFWQNGTETREHNGDISVLIPCYNQSKYVKTAVSSCLKQTQKPKQVLVLLMDNDSYNIKSELESMSDIVKCYCEPQMNVCKARTYLAEKCKTDWLIFLDADDFILRDFIKKLDESDAAVVCPNHINLTSKELTLNINELQIESGTTSQNLTSLMHRDVFFNIGLKEEFCLGGEDFDFWLSLWEKKKWKIDYIKDVYYIYVIKTLDISDGLSLSHTEDFYNKLFTCLSYHKKLLLEGVEYSPFLKDKLKEKWALETSTKEALYKLAINYEENGKDVNSELDYFVNYIRNEFDYYSKVSPIKDTDWTYNKNDYVFVNCNPNCIDETEIENTCFDAIFFELYCGDVEELIVKDKSMIIRRDLWEQTKKLTPIDQVFYLLKNYSCFIKNKTNDIRKQLLTRNNDFINALKNITFDEKAKTSAKLLYDYYCEGMYTTINRNPYIVAFILHKTCTRNCPYCFQKGQHNQVISDEEMYKNFDKALTYFENLVKTDNSKYLQVQILGGEPTEWSEWLQNKVLKRLEKYNYFVLFTNGANKKSPIYKTFKSLKKLHIVDWEKEMAHNPVYPINEQPLIILQEKDRNKYKAIFDKYSGGPIYLAMCKSDSEEERASYGFMKELASLPQKYSWADNSTVKAYVEAVEAKGLEQVKKECYTNTHIVSVKAVNVDCATLQVQPCCNAKKTYPLEQFNFSTKSDYDADCRFCNYIY